MHLGKLSGAVAAEPAGASSSLLPPPESQPGQGPPQPPSAVCTAHPPGSSPGFPLRPACSLPLSRAMEEPGQGCPEAGGGHRARAEEGAAESQIRKAVEFKAEGNRCYKEKKFREAIGKYHRALLQLKGVQGRAGAASPEQSPPDPGRCPLTEEQLRLVESTEVGVLRQPDGLPAAVRAGELRAGAGILPESAGETRQQLQSHVPGGHRLLPPGGLRPRPALPEGGQEPGARRHQCPALHPADGAEDPASGAAGRLQGADCIGPPRPPGQSAWCPAVSSFPFPPTRRRLGGSGGG
ncbi:unnamed protein product [Lepidochelys kempii]